MLTGALALNLGSIALVAGAVVVILSTLAQLFKPSRSDEVQFWRDRASTFEAEIGVLKGQMADLRHEVEELRKRPDMSSVMHAIEGLAQLSKSNNDLLQILVHKEAMTS